MVEAGFPPPPFEELLAVLVNRVELVAHDLEHGGHSAYNCALRLRQGVASVMEACGTLRGPLPVQRPEDQVRERG